MGTLADPVIQEESEGEAGPRVIPITTGTAVGVKGRLVGVNVGVNITVGGGPDTVKGAPVAKGAPRSVV